MSADTATLQLRCALGHTRFPACQILRWRNLGQICHDCFRRNGADPFPALPPTRTAPPALPKSRLGSIIQANAKPPTAQVDKGRD